MAEEDFLTNLNQALSDCIEKIERMTAPPETAEFINAQGMSRNTFQISEFANFALIELDALTDQSYRQISSNCTWDVKQAIADGIVKLQ